jgi:hypothetical protein
MALQTRKAHERYRQKESLIEDGLREIFRYILRLKTDYEFDKSAYSLEQKIREPIREAREQQLTGKEAAEDVEKITRRLVRQELDL